MDLVSPRTAAIIWVVDSNNRDADLSEEGIELRTFHEQFANPKIPVLVIANKQDLPNARPLHEINELMGYVDTH